MFHSIIFLLFIVVFNDVCIVAAWDPINFTFNPGNNYELVFTDEFENVGPVKAMGLVLNAEKENIENADVE